MLFSRYESTKVDSSNVQAYMQFSCSLFCYLFSLFDGISWCIVSPLKLPYM